MASRAATGTALPISPVVTYLTAHFAKSLIWHSSILLFAFYLTETCGLPPRLAGAILGGSLAANGFADLAIGALKDRTIADAKGAIRFQRTGALVVAASFVLFCMASLTGPDYRPAVAMVSLIALRISYCTVDVAQNALLSLGGYGEEDRFGLVAWRMIASGAAILTVATLVAPALVLHQEAAPFHFATIGTVMAGLLVASSLWLRPGGQPRALSLQAMPETGTRADTAFVVALVMVALTGFSGTLFGKLQAYYGAYGGGDASLTLMIAVASGNLLSQPLWLTVQRRYGTTTTLVASALVTICAGTAFLLAMRSAMVVALGMGMGIGIGSGGSGLSLWGIVATLGARSRPMLRFGIFTCLSKLSQGAGAAVLGLLLGEMDYRHVMAAQGNRLVETMVLAPVLAALVSIPLARMARHHLK